MDDFILDTLTYECVGNRDVENFLDEDKSNRCNENRSIYCQAGFYIRFWEQKGSTCIVEYDKLVTQFKIGID